MMILALILALPFIVVTLAFVIEVVVGTPADRRIPQNHSQAASATMVIPANNEAAVIAQTVGALTAAARPGMRLLVVADNCTDDTAARATMAGADVLERHDPIRRGKGFALSFARDHLANAPPDCVVVIDADCRADAISLAALVDTAAASQRPVQAINLLLPDLTAAPMVQISNFAFAIKNLVRQRGLERLSGRVHLTGTGMAFPWAIFASAPLATGDVVEDLGLGLDLAARGVRPVLVSDAHVWSAASGSADTLKQRTRWEGGFIKTSLRRGIPTMLGALRRADPRGIWAGLSLMVPPVALLVLADLVAGGLLLAVAMATGAWLPFWLLAGSGALALVALVTAWWKVGRPFLAASVAIRAPLYVLWKLPVYLRLTRQPLTWMRVER